MRPPTSSLEPHPAVQATIEHLTSCAPLPELHLEYFGAETPTYVWLTHSEAPQVVVPGAAMASCHVQIHDQNRRPITAMPFVSGEGEDLTMMRKIRLRRVQFVRKAGESDDCWVSIMGDGEGDSGFKSYNTWDFAKISARATQMATRDFGQDLTEAQSTFRVPMGFRHSDGAPDKTDSMLYPFENTCLEHKIEIVAVLHKKAAPNTQDLEARDTSGTWKPQSKWRAIVTVKPDTASAASVKLVSERTQRVSVQDPYFLGEPLPESLLLIMSDGYTINQTVGNLIAWPTSQLKEPRLDGRTDVDGLSKTVLRLVTDPKTQKQVPPKFAQLPHAQSVELLPPFDQPPSVMVMNGGMKVDGLRLEPFTEFRFSPDAPSMCDLTFSFDKRDDKLAVGRLAVLPGPPPPPPEPPLPPLPSPSPLLSSLPPPPPPQTYRSIQPLDGGQCAMPGQTTDAHYCCAYTDPTLLTQQDCEDKCNADVMCVAYSWKRSYTSCGLYDAAALPDLAEVVGSRSLSPPQGHGDANCYVSSRPLPPLPSPSPSPPSPPPRSPSPPSPSPPPPGPAAPPPPPSPPTKPPSPSPPPILSVGEAELLAALEELRTHVSGKLQPHTPQGCNPMHPKAATP